MISSVYELKFLSPKTKEFLIGVIYRPPDSSKYLIENFNGNLSRVVQEDKECVLTCDINYDYLGSSDHSSASFKAFSLLVD